MDKSSFKRAIVDIKNCEKNNLPNPHPIPDSTGTVPATYSGYLSTFKRTGYSGGPLLAAV